MRLVYVLIGWAAGIITAANWTSLSPSGWAVLAVIAAAAVTLTWRTTDYRMVNIILLALTLGGMRYAQIPTTSDIAQYNNIGGMTIEGVVVSEPDIRDDRTLLRIRSESITRAGETRPTSGLVLVRAPRTTDARYGDRIAVTGLLFTPGTYDRFSYADYLAREGVFSVMENTIVTVASSGHGNPFLASLYALRRQAVITIGHYLPEPQAGLLTGILIGNERGISPELQDDFSVTGASHIIAISGFNMIIIAGVVMGVLRRTKISPRWAAVIGIVVILIYAVFAGANAAVLRAALMSAVLITGQTIRRQTYVPASLAFVTLLMTAIHPTVLWDVSFQLSFFAVLGLAFFVDPLTRYFNRGLEYLFPPRVAAQAGALLREPLMVTVAAQITTLPIILVHFGRLSLVALPVNMLVVPVQAYLLITGGLATILAFLPPLAQILYWLDMVLLSWSIGVVRVFAELRFADTQVYIDNWIITLYFTVMIGWSIMHATQPDWWLSLSRFVRQRAVTAALIFAGFALTVLMGSVALSRPDGKLHVWFLDMGHSNAVFAQTPGGAHILIDGGRFPSRLLTAIGDRMPFYDRTIEVVVITQPDDLDTAALTAVLGRYNTGVVLTNGQPNLSDVSVGLEEELTNHEVVVARAGYTLELSDGALLEVLHPQRTPTIADPLNDHSLVLRLSYGSISFLLTGDVSTDGQISMLAAPYWPLATVIQLPQHGTSNSLEGDFLAAVQPQAVVIQVDRANRRGDPHPDVLAMLPEQIPPLSTSENGTIHLWTDGIELWLDQGSDDLR